MVGSAKPCEIKNSTPGVPLRFWNPLAATRICNILENHVQALRRLVRRYEALRPLLFQVWDMAGASRYNSANSMYVSHSLGSSRRSTGTTSATATGISSEMVKGDPLSFLWYLQIRSNALALLVSKGMTIVCLPFRRSKDRWF